MISDFTWTVWWLGLSFIGLGSSIWVLTYGLEWVTERLPYVRESKYYYEWRVLVSLGWAAILFFSVLGMAYHGYRLWGLLFP